MRTSSRHAPDDAGPGSSSASRSKAQSLLTAGPDWLAEDDQALRRGMAVLGHEDQWERIAEEYMESTKTPAQCKARCQDMLNTTIKGSWTAEEDDLIVRLVDASDEAPSWAAIARALPGRIGKQCRERWVNHLDPTLKRTPFSPEEDDMLLNLHKELGNKWAVIARHLPGRSDNAVKNRWYSKFASSARSAAPKRRAPSSAASVTSTDTAQADASARAAQASTARKPGRRKKAAHSSAAEPLSPAVSRAAAITTVTRSGRRATRRGTPLVDEAAIAEDAAAVAAQARAHTAADLAEVEAVAGRKRRRHSLDAIEALETLSESYRTPGRHGDGLSDLFVCASAVEGVDAAADAKEFSSVLASMAAAVTQFAGDRDLLAGTRVQPPEAVHALAAAVPPAAGRAHSRGGSESDTSGGVLELMSRGSVSSAVSEPGNAGIGFRGHARAGQLQVPSHGAAAAAGGPSSTGSAQSGKPPRPHASTEAARASAPGSGPSSGTGRPDLALPPNVRRAAAPATPAALSPSMEIQLPHPSLMTLGHYLGADGLDLLQGLPAPAMPAMQ